MGVPKRMISAIATRFVSTVTRSASRVTSLVSPSRRSPGDSSAKIATIGSSRNASEAVVATPSSDGERR